MLWSGGTCIDLEGRQVHRDGEPCHLEPRAFDVLAHLVRHRDRLVPKEELLDEVWGDRFVSETALTTRIKEVRQALGDDGTRQAVIRTERGRGYRFVAPVSERAPDPVGTAAPGAVHPARSRLRREPLVGRDRERAEVAELLERCPLVTLVGPGGVGKTALALTVADEAAGRHADGLVVVDLGRIADAEAVVPALQRAAVLSAPAPDGAAVLTAVAALDALVVLDGCEHLVDQVAEVVDGLLAVGGPVRVLATSRERLGVPGEQVRPVEPLDPTAARELLRSRIEAVAPGAAPLDTDPGLVDELLEAVDRLPLGIEMAAARAASLSLPELVALLRDRLDVLRSGSRTVAQRHRTLDAVVGWSVSLLHPAERALLVDCSVFAGPVGVDDVVGALGPLGHGDRAEVVDLLAGLVDRSLLAADVAAAPATYRMLATVRAHAARRREPVVAAAHAAWFAEVARGADELLRGPAERAGHDRIEGVAAELRAAHRWARHHDPALAVDLVAALGLHAYTRLWSEPASWAGELEALLPAEHPGRAALAVVVAGDAAQRGELDRARSVAVEALAGGGEGVAVAALDILADVAIYRGELDEVRRLAARLRQLGEARGDGHALALAVVDEAVSWAYGGDRERALAVLDGYEGGATSSPSDGAWLAYAEAEAVAATDPGRAVHRLAWAAEQAEVAGNRFLAGVVLAALSSLQARTGDPGVALATFAATLDDCRRHGNLVHGVTVVRNLVELLVRVGDDEPAMTLLGALEGGDVAPTYGDEARRLVAARDAVERRVGMATVARWEAAGTGRGARWALDHALDALARRDVTPRAAPDVAPRGPARPG